MQTPSIVHCMIMHGHTACTARFSWHVSAVFDVAVILPPLLVTRDWSVIVSLVALCEACLNGDMLLIVLHVQLRLLPMQLPAKGFKML